MRAGAADSAQRAAALMRAEGDISNLITSATIWRRIGIIGEGVGGIVLVGHPGNAETTELQRFLLRDSYPHRVVDVPREEAEKTADPLTEPRAVVSGGDADGWTEAAAADDCGACG